MSLAIIPLLFLVGCNRPDVIPDDLEGKVDRDLRYVQVKDNAGGVSGQAHVSRRESLVGRPFERRDPHRSVADSIELGLGA